MNVRGYRELLGSAGVTITLILCVVGEVCRGDTVTNRLSLTLDECIRIGLEKSVSAANAARDRRIAGAKVVQARAGALPQLGASASYRRQDELQTIELEGQTAEIGSLDNYSASVSVNQLLYSGGKVRTAIQAAHLAGKGAGFQEASVNAKLVRDIRTGFYDILLADAAVGVREESLAQLKGLVKQTSDRYTNGRASEFEMLTSKVRFANEEPPLIEARNAYSIALEQYKLLLNLDRETDLALDGTLRFQPLDADLTDLEDTALSARSEIQEARIRVALLEKDEAATRSDSFPRITAAFEYQGINPENSFSGANAWRWGWYAGVNAQWDLWDGGLRRGKVREKALLVEKAREDLGFLKKQVLLEVKEAFLDMRHAEESVKATRGNVALAEKALQIATARNEEGMSTYIEFTDANLALKNARLAELTALRNHMNAIARLDYAIGAKYERESTDPARTVEDKGEE